MSIRQEVKLPDNELCDTCGVRIEGIRFAAESGHKAIPMFSAFCSASAFSNKG